MKVHDKFIGILFVIFLLTYGSKPIIVRKEATPDNRKDNKETSYFDTKNENLAFDSNEQHDDKTEITPLESIYSIQDLSDRVEQIEFDSFPEKTVIRDKDDPKIYIKVIRVNPILTNDGPCKKILEFSEKFFKLKFDNPENLESFKSRIIINDQNKKLICYKSDDNVTKILYKYDHIQNNNHTITDTSVKNISNDTDVNKKDYETQENLNQSNLFSKDYGYLKTKEETRKNEIPLQSDIIEEDRNFVKNKTNDLMQTHLTEENIMERNPKGLDFYDTNTFNTTIDERMNKFINISEEKQNLFTTDKILIPQTHKLLSSEEMISSEHNNYHIDISTTSPLLNKIEDTHKQQNQHSSSILDNLSVQSKVKMNKNEFYFDVHTSFDPNFINYVITTDGPDNISDRLKHTTESINLKPQNKFTISSNNQEEKQLIHFKPSFKESKLKTSTENIIENRSEKSIIDESFYENNSSEIRRTTEGIDETITENYKFSINEDYLIETYNKLYPTTKSPDEISTSNEDITTNTLILQNSDSPVIVLDFNNTNTKILQNENNNSRNYTDLEHNSSVVVSDHNNTNEGILQNENDHSKNSTDVKHDFSAVISDHNKTNEETLQNENSHFRNYTDLEHNYSVVTSDHNNTNKGISQNENDHLKNFIDLEHNSSAVVSYFDDKNTKILQNESDHLKNFTDSEHNSFGNSVLSASVDTIKGAISGAAEGIRDKTNEYGGAAVEAGVKAIGIGKKGVNYLEYGANYLGSQISSFESNPTNPTIKPIINHQETLNSNIKPKNSSKKMKFDASKPKTQNNNFTRTLANNEDKSKFTSGHKNNIKVAESDYKNRTKKSEKILDSVNATTTKKNLHQETQTKPPKRNLTSHNKPRKTTENPLICKYTNKTTNYYPFYTKTSTQKPFNLNANQNNLKNGSVLQNKIFEKAENFTKFKTQGMITKLEDKLETIDNFIQIGKVGLSFIGVLISLFCLMKYLKFFGCRK